MPNQPRTAKKAATKAAEPSKRARKPAAPKVSVRLLRVNLIPTYVVEQDGDMTEVVGQEMTFSGKDWRNVKEQVLIQPEFIEQVRQQYLSQSGQVVSDA